MIQNDLTPEHFVLAARHALASDDAAHVEHDAPRILASAHRMGLRVRVQLRARPAIPCVSDWWGDRGVWERGAAEIRRVWIEGVEVTSSGTHAPV